MDPDTFLESLSLGQYVSAFVDNGVEASNSASLTDVRPHDDDIVLSLALEGLRDRFGAQENSRELFSTHHTTGPVLRGQLQAPRPPQGPGSPLASNPEMRMFSHVLHSV